MTSKSSEKICVPNILNWLDFSGAHSAQMSLPNCEKVYHQYI